MNNNVIKYLDFCYAYIDDLVVCSDNWSDHMKHFHDIFDRKPTVEEPSGSPSNQGDSSGPHKGLVAIPTSSPQSK